MPALVTPFSEAGDLDAAAHRYNLEALSTVGVEGFLLGGSTGEGPYLEAGERRDLVAIARDTLGERAYLMCGISAESVRGAATQIAEAAEGGADAVLVMSPTSLARGNHGTVVRYYTHVADGSPLPVLLYSVPAVTGYEIPVEHIAALAPHPNIVGLKDSGGRPVRIQEAARTVEQPFIMYGGASRTLAPSMAAGGHGAITASANYASSLVRALVDASAESQAKADTIQLELTALVQIVEAFGNPGTQSAAAAWGLRPGYPRLPLVPVSPDDAATIAAAVKATLGDEV
jgi:4-hydroxy-2-oxoglutarate aldolase